MAFGKHFHKQWMCVALHTDLLPLFFSLSLLSHSDSFSSYLWSRALSLFVRVQSCGVRRRKRWFLVTESITRRLLCPRRRGRRHHHRCCGRNSCCCAYYQLFDLFFAFNVGHHVTRNKNSCDHVLFSKPLIYNCLENDIFIPCSTQNEQKRQEEEKTKRI